jgi:hypothetical protein
MRKVVGAVSSACHDVIAILDMAKRLFQQCQERGGPQSLDHEMQNLS